MSGGPVIPVGTVLPAMDAPPDRVGPQAATGAGTQQTEPGGHDDTEPKRSGGRWQVLNTFCDLSARALGGASVAVWLQLFRHANRGGRVRMSQAEIGRCVGRSRRSVHSAMRQLKAAGLVSVVHRGSLRAGVATYQVHSGGKEGL